MKKFLTLLILLVSTLQIQAKQYQVEEIKTFFNSSDTIGIVSRPDDWFVLIDEDCIVLTDKERIILNFAYENMQNKNGIKVGFTNEYISGLKYIIYINGNSIAFKPFNNGINIKIKLRNKIWFE